MARPSRTRTLAKVLQLLKEEEEEEDQATVR
jgi:hypothetical protein